MPTVIPVAHDFICPWCWLGLSQVQKLQLEFDVEFDWIGYELWPIELEWPEPGPKSEVVNTKPPTPTKFDLALAVEGLPKTFPDRPRRMRSNNAHQAVEFAKTLGVADLMISKLYRAYWIRGEDINNVEVIQRLSGEFIPDPSDMIKAIENINFAVNGAHHIENNIRPRIRRVRPF